MLLILIVPEVCRCEATLHQLSEAPRDAQGHRNTVFAHLEGECFHALSWGVSLIGLPAVFVLACMP